MFFNPFQKEDDMKWDVEGYIFNLKEGEVALVSVKPEESEATLFGIPNKGSFNFFLNEPGFYLRFPWEKVTVNKIWAH